MRTFEEPKMVLWQHFFKSVAEVFLVPQSIFLVKLDL